MRIHIQRKGVRTRRAFSLRAAIPLALLFTCLSQGIFVLLYASSEEVPAAPPPVSAENMSLWEPIPAPAEDPVPELPLPQREPAPADGAWERLEGINPDFRGILSIPALGLTYPVVQGRDNFEYLEKSFEGASDPAGAVFLDAAASGFSDAHCFVFAHNMKNGSMFGSLQRYLMEPGLFSDAWDVEIRTREEVLHYRIYAVYVTREEDGATYRYAPEDRRQYAAAAAARAMAGSGLAGEDPGRLLTLSTCHGIGFGETLAVQAVLLEEEVRSTKQSP